MSEFLSVKGILILVAVFLLGTFVAGISSAIRDATRQFTKDAWHGLVRNIKGLPSTPSKLRDSWDWLRYRPHVSLINNDIGIRYEIDHNIVRQCRVYVAYEVTSRNYYGRARVDFVKSYVEVRPEIGKRRPWFRLIAQTIGGNDPAIEFEIGSPHQINVTYAWPLENTDVTKVPKLEYEFRWRVHGVTANLSHFEIRRNIRRWRGRKRGRRSA